MSSERGALQPIERLGGDVVFRDGDGIVIESSAPMPEWEARNFRRVEVIYDDTSYCLEGASHARKGNRTRYALRPWPDDDDPVAISYLYDARFVEERDQARSQLAVAKSVNLVLTPLEPLLGFLPGAVLTALADRYGVHAERAHGFSIFIELMASMTLMVAMFFAEALGWSQDRLFPVAVLLFIDAAMRYHHRLAESRYLYAPFEWVFKRR